MLNNMNIFVLNKIIKEKTLDNDNFNPKNTVE